MCKKFITGLALVLLAGALYGQQHRPLQTLNTKRKQQIRAGMITLGSWSALNIATGSVLMPRATGARYYFLQMNVLWNIANLGIAGLGYYNNMRSPLPKDLPSSVTEHYRLQKILLFNAGLDLAYMATGFYVKERASRSDNTDRLIGYGNAVILQGAFLLIFDSVLYWVLQRQQERLQDILYSVKFTGNSIGFRKIF